MKVRVYLQTHIDLDVGEGWALPQDNQRLQRLVEDKLRGMTGQVIGGDYTPMFIVAGLEGMGQHVHVFNN